MTAARSITCWNCLTQMRFYAQTGYHDFFICPVCKVEHAEYDPEATLTAIPAVPPQEHNGYLRGQDEHIQS